MLLLVTWRRGFDVVAVVALLLLLAFTALVGLSLAKGERPSCHCFGEISAEPISERTLARNGALSLAALAALVLDRPFGGVVPTLADLDAPSLVLVLVSVVLGGLLWWMWTRAVAAERALATAREQIAELEARPTSREPIDIPSATVTDRAGTTFGLTELVETKGKAQLLIGVSPDCGACKTLEPMIPGWREQVGHEIDITLLSYGTYDEAVAAYPDHAEHLVASPDGSAFEALKIGGTPGAVLLGLNGKLAAGPALGADQIVELLLALVQAIGVNMMTGRAHTVTDPRPLGGEDTGAAMIPETGSTLVDVTVRDDAGRESTLVEALQRIAPGRAVPVVAWRDSCPYCQEIAPEMGQFSERSEVVLLVNEPIETVRAQGLTGPALQTVEAGRLHIHRRPRHARRHPDDQRRRRRGRRCRRRVGAAHAHRPGPGGGHLRRDAGTRAVRAHHGPTSVVSTRVPLRSSTTMPVTTMRGMRGTTTPVRWLPRCRHRAGTVTPTSRTRCRRRSVPPPPVRCPTTSIRRPFRSSTGSEVVVDGFHIRYLDREPGQLPTNDTGLFGSR